MISQRNRDSFTRREARLDAIKECRERLMEVIFDIEMRTTIATELGKLEDMERSLLTMAALDIAKEVMQDKG
jgi:hypothetical protein